MFVTEKDRYVPIASWPHLTMVLMLLASFSWFLGASGFTQFAAKPLSSPDHRSAVIRFCTAVIVFLWIVGALIAVGLRRFNSEGVSKLIGIEKARVAGVWRTSLQAILVFACLLIVGSGSNALLTHWGSNRPTMQGMAATNTPEASVFLLASLTAGFAEELIFRGYLQQQFQALTRNVITASLLQIAAFTLGHLYQGFGRLLPVLLIACVLTISARWTKTLIPGMIAHGLGDGIVAIAYFIHSLRH